MNILDCFLNYPYYNTNIVGQIWKTRVSKNQKHIVAEPIHTTDWMWTVQFNTSGLGWISFSTHRHYKIVLLLTGFSGVNGYNIMIFFFYFWIKYIHGYLGTFYKLSNWTYIKYICMDISYCYLCVYWVWSIILFFVFKFLLIFVIFIVSPKILFTG